MQEGGLITRWLMIRLMISDNFMAKRKLSEIRVIRGKEEKSVKIRVIRGKKEV